MKDGPNIIGIAALLGDRARAEVLTALMSGMALTATELAEVAGVTKQTISCHLAKLVEAHLLVVEAQGRHRYFRLADHDVAQLLESLMNVAFRTGAVRMRSSPREPALRKARVCYDHLAGELGVHVYDQLVLAGSFTFGADGVQLAPAGLQAMHSLGIDTGALASKRRSFCRTCLDWSERRHHLAGALGSALLARFEELGWARRARDSRVVTFTTSGEQQLRAWVRATAVETAPAE
jgi:DNA-binding transcriptional ArsR family regulator